MQKQVIFKTKGMQRDLSVSAFNSEFSYENMNMRIMPTNENTLLSLTNEKGPKEVSIINLEEGLEGITIGKATLNDNLVLFNSGQLFIDIGESDIQDIPNVEEIEVSNAPSIFCGDYIYKIWLNSDNNLEGKLLYSGELNLNPEYPIETLSIYENDNIQKVYWTDGLNQPRVINIAASNDIIKSWNNTSFDFVQKLKLNEEISIKKTNTSNGSFGSGVIQYAFTYYINNGQESNIFYTSPLYYISFNDRGGSPEETINNSFDITIRNFDNTFDGIRVYSIQRTSINGIPYIKRVVDLPVKNIQDETLQYTDSGTIGNTIDPTELLYIGGEEIIAGTLNQKDNTLFLGDITIKRDYIDKDIRESLKGDITFQNNYGIIAEGNLELPEPIGYYPYINQLSNPSSKIKTFKYLETYRFGVQFQHYTGKWSEPIWIKDKKNTQHVKGNYTEGGYIYLPYATYYCNNTEIINKLISKGYIKARPVIVYPSFNDRDCICQGVLCPTVFNVGDRYSNTPFVQSSWFTRPNAPFDFDKTDHYKKDELGNWVADWRARDKSFNVSIDSKKGVLTNEYTILSDNEDYTDEISINKGSYAEFRHFYPIPSNENKNAEIQCIINPPLNPYVDASSKSSDISNGFVANNREDFYIDQSIVTFHSPDIEFDDSLHNLNQKGLQLRIIGMVPITATVGDIDIQTSTLGNTYFDASTNVLKYSGNQTTGFYKEPIGVKNISRFGWRGLISGGFWFDEISDIGSGTVDLKSKDFPSNYFLFNNTKGFVVYPFHRNGSLNNDNYGSNGVKSAMLDKKRLSNLRFSYNSIYLDENKIYNFYDESNDNLNGISGVSVFNSDEVTLTKIPAPENSGLSDLYYYGNVDKVITPSLYGDKRNGYPILTTKIEPYKGDGTTKLTYHETFTSKYQKIDGKITSSLYGFDPISMRYKSTPHIVMALNYTKDNKQVILPTLQDGEYTYPSTLNKWDINKIGNYNSNAYKPFWDIDNNCKGIYQDALDVDLRAYNNSLSGYSIEYGWLWLGEIYNPNVVNKFGGTSEEALANNLWLPCGESISLLSNGVPKNNFTLFYTEGDTYYQRYDHIKTYSSLEEQNGITDIISFMCETRINLDGRYDKNRGQITNFVMSPTNFNKMNKVYSQDNNYFNYRFLNLDDVQLDNFHNSITWTKTKMLGEDTDSWTNISLASILDLDGNKGYIRSIQRFNNNLIAFQDKGISQILYNESVQIPTSNNIPIELGNSGKVTGKRYISDTIGCTNKWSICKTPNGIYFIDDISKKIFLFNGNVESLSDKLGFHSWINEKLKNTEIWNPADFNGFVTYYDNINSDVFFISKDSCLTYSELLGQFSSFYSYEHTHYFANLKNKGLWVKHNINKNKSKLWLHNEGDYNMFFGSYKPFYTTLVVNPEPIQDKVFNNIEFRSDTWDNNTLLDITFDTLTTWNEYQYGETKLKNTFGIPSTLKKKFRMWRANIPRDNKNNRDRMRNPWLYLKLSMNEENTNKTILHDIIVKYFE